MAATGTSRPSATLIALASLLAVLALAANPASASQLNYYRGEGCTGGIVLSCFDGMLCRVPAEARSFEFHYVLGFPLLAYLDVNCNILNKFIDRELPCNDNFFFDCARIEKPSLLKMATEK